MEGLFDLNELLIKYGYLPADQKDQHFANMIDKAENRYFPVFEKVCGKDVVAQLILLSCTSTQKAHVLWEKTEEKLPLEYSCSSFGGAGSKGETGHFRGDGRHFILGAVWSSETPSNPEVPKCPCFNLCVVSDRQHYSISIDIKFSPEVQMPLQHTCHVKALQFLLYLIELSFQYS